MPSTPARSILTIETGLQYDDWLPVDCLARPGDGNRFYVRERYVYRITVDERAKHHLALYTGTTVPKEADIFFHTTSDGRIWPVYRLGHQVEPPLRKDNELPYSTIVKFREELPVAPLPRRSVAFKLNLPSRTQGRWRPNNTSTSATVPGPPALIPHPPHIQTHLAPNHYRPSIHRRTHKLSLFESVNRFFGHDAGSDVTDMSSVGPSRKRSLEAEFEEGVRSAKRVCTALAIGGVGYYFASTLAKGVV